MTSANPHSKGKSGRPAPWRGQGGQGGHGKGRPRRGSDVDDRRYRPNVAMIVQNRVGQVLWARRVGGQDAWQFPQGGIRTGEEEEQALYRELREELGLARDDVEFVARTEGWLRYRVPLRSQHSGFVGQTQRWYLLRLLASDDAVQVHGKEAEFDDWRWVSYWYPLNAIVEFKRAVYRRALGELAPALRVDERVIRQAEPKPAG